MLFPRGITTILLGITLIPFAHADWNADYKQLTQGVDALEMGGTAGSIAVLGRMAFVIAQSTQRQPTVAGGYTGDEPGGGRVLALAHTSFVSSTTPAMQQWLKNAAEWTGKKAQPEMLILGGSPKEWQTAGLKPLVAPKAWSPALLEKVQVVYINLHSVSDELATAATPDLLKFAKGGGGLILSATPWALKPEALNFAAKLMQPAGISFLGSGPSEPKYAVSTPPSPYASALRALDAIAMDFSGTAKLGFADKQIATSALEACLAANMVPESLEKPLLALHQKTGWTVLNKENALRRNAKPVEALMARFESWWLQRQPPTKTPAHPLAADYPGLPAEGPVQKKLLRFNATTSPDVLINHGDRTRIATGLYAKPGSPIKVSIPAEAAAAGWKVEIGIHVDKNWNLNAWRRFPEISTLTELKQAETLAVNSFGGLVSILLPAKCPVGESQALIEGAVEAPTFKLGETTAAEWKKRSHAPGAWGYLETPLWTGYFSRAQLQAMEDPAAVATYWHKAVETADQYLGYGPWRKRGESMLVDRDIYVGYGHAGYPVMMMYGAETGDGPDALMKRGPIQGDWGFLHELGHTFQDSFDGNYTIAAHGEVDVNLVPALVLQKLHNRTCYDNNSHGTFDAKSRISDWEKWSVLPENERTWAKACKMNVAYDFYFTLAECFGWDLYSRAFGRWMRWLQKPGGDPAMDAIPEKAPNAKRDRFFTLFCEESGFNLLPYFEKYGLGKGEFGISDAAKARVAKLPVWSGNRPIEGVGAPEQLAVPKGTGIGTVLTKLSAKDPDPGTIFSYKIVSGNEDGALGLDARSGALTLQKTGASPQRSVVVEVQDNCIPLSTAKATIKLLFQ